MTSEKRPDLRVVRASGLATEPAAPRTKEDDAELVRAFRSGHRDAAIEIYNAHSMSAERMLVRMLGYVPERVDLLHDVFVRVFESVDSLRDPSALRPWICGIALRRAQEHIREQKRRRTAQLDEHPAWTGDPEVSLTMRRVYALLDRLDADDRAAFVLRRIEGMELSEVASVCDVSLATVKRRIARAEELFTEWASSDAVLREKIS